MKKSNTTKANVIVLALIAILLVVILWSIKYPEYFNPLIKWVKFGAVILFLGMSFTVIISVVGTKIRRRTYPTTQEKIQSYIRATGSNDWIETQSGIVKTESYLMGFIEHFNQ